MQNPGPGVRLRSYARTSTGQVRENNEDNIHLLADDHFVLAIVADGMGGAAAGEQASRIAIETINESLNTTGSEIHEKYRNMEDGPLSEMLRDVIRSANFNIVQQALDIPAYKGMGTTVTLAMVRNNQAIIAHVGDSRAYQVDGKLGDITQITSDHSFVEALVAAGHITPEEAEVHPMKNVLYRALGQTDDIEVDIYYHHLEIGDRLVLCSDGLTRHLKAKEIAENVLENDDPEVASQKLIDLANVRGGEDNISTVVIVVEADPNATSSSLGLPLAAENDDDDTLLLADRAKYLHREKQEPDIQPPEQQPDRPANQANSYNGMDGEGRDTSIPDQ